MSRSEEKLQKVAIEISELIMHIPWLSCDSMVLGERYGREVRVLSVDFSQGQQVYDDIQAEISDLDVAILGEYIVMTRIIIIIMYSF